MSASTVSITANPAARRRPVVVSDQRRNLGTQELFPADAQTPAAGAGDRTAVAGDAILSRDLSHHSIRGEAVTSREAVQVKKTSSTVSPRKGRRGGAGCGRLERPWWLRAVSIFAKNFVLLMVIAGLIQLVRKVVMDSTGYGGAGDGVGGFHPGMSDLEERIAEVEKVAKTTAKMLQVQVEVVDKKLESEVGGLRREFDKKIGDKDEILERELGKLVERSKGLERSVAELKASGGDWLSREEFERFYEELKKGKGGVFGGGDGDVSLEDIRVYARDIVEKEIEKHAADGLGLPDYALASGGAAVVKHSEPYMPWKVGSWLLEAARGGVRSSAVRMLTPSFGEPGQCFPLKGCAGFVQIKLRTAIIPEAFTLEHVAKSVAFDRSSAPKDCRISGWLQNREIDSPAASETMFLLAEFSYDLEKSNAQTFDVIDSSTVGLVDNIRLDFLSNHGSPSHTCIYRLRVHGHEPDLASLASPQP